MNEKKFRLDIPLDAKNEIAEVLKRHEERIQKLEEALDKSYQMLDNTLRGLKELRTVLSHNPQPVKEEGLYPWHRKD